MSDAGGPCPQLGKVMLSFQLAIHREEGVDLAARPRQQIPILHAGPTQPCTVRTS